MAEQYTPKDFKSNQEIRWCPGCGDHGIINSVQKAMAELGYPKERGQLFPESDVLPVSPIT